MDSRSARPGVSERSDCSPIVLPNLGDADAPRDFFGPLRQLLLKHVPHFVVDAVVLDPAAGEHREWTVEATLTADRIPADVVSEVAAAGADILQAPMRAPGVHQLVVAV